MKFWLMLMACAVLSLPAWGQPPELSAAQREVFAVAESAELTQAQKVERLREMAGTDETRQMALYSLDRVDRAAAKETAVSQFRSKSSTRDAKLWLGHFILTGRGMERADYPQEFVKEYADRLVAAVLDGGQAEFCRPLPGHPVTAVGEYAYLASDFDGYKEVDFPPFKDARVVPVLIRCLDAPDNVWSDDSDVRMGNPGEASGRNTARQQIPVALARLDASDAVEPLKRVLRTHHDWCERDNSAYALARLTPPAEHAALIAEMRRAKAVSKDGRMDAARDRFFHLYAFGRGLLDRGDDGGIEFMAFEYSIYNRDDELSAVIYMLEQRVQALQKTRSPKLGAFFGQAFADERVVGVLLLDKSKIRIGDYGPGYGMAAAEPRIQAIFGQMCGMIEGNDLRGLRPAMEMIAKKSGGAGIRKRAAECAATLGAQ